MTEETKRKISETLKRKYASGEITTYRQSHNWKPIHLYHKDGSYYKSYDCLADCAKDLNIRKINLGKIRTIKGYQFSFEKVDKMPMYISNNKRAITDGSNVYMSIKEASFSFNVNKSTIYNWIKSGKLEYLDQYKLRELLEHPEKDDQQRSLDSNIFERSETRCESL